MGLISSDPLQNAINDGIKRGIRVAIENECFGSAVTLIYAAIDTMAYLGMPDGQQDVTRKDFVAWADRYIRFPCREQIAGTELYGARCAMLHNYGVHSKLSREGKARVVSYMRDEKPEVRAHPSVPDLVLVSISALAECVLTGIDHFLIDVFKDPQRAKVAEVRLKENLVCVFHTGELLQE